MSNSLAVADFMGYKEPPPAARRWKTSVDVVAPKIERRDKTTAGRAAAHTGLARRAAKIVRSELERSTEDWRTLSSLAEDLDIPVSVVRLGIAALGDDVRQPIAIRGHERDWYRLRSRGLTRAEIFRYLMLSLSRSAR